MLVRNNQGVTLVELIIVMLIISILAGGAVVGVRGLDSGNTRSTVKRIDALLEYVRVLNMSKAYEYSFNLKNDGGAYTVEIKYYDNINHIDVVVLTEKLNLKDGNITYVDDTGAIVSIDSKLIFAKDSGSIKESSGKNITEIRIRSSSRAYTIHLVTATGKHYFE